MDAQSAQTTGKKAKENFVSGFLYTTLSMYLNGKNRVFEHPKKLKLETALRELCRGNVYSFISFGSNIDEAYTIITQGLPAEVLSDPGRTLRCFCSVYPAVYRSLNSTLFDPEDFEN